MSESNVQADLYRPASSVLELRGVSCAYDAGRPAVSDISFAAQEGEILCLLGPSGCGKTTILRAIAGFEPVRSGQIFLSGQLVSSPDQMIPTEDRHVGMVFQEYALFPHLRVQENIAFGLRRLSRSERKVRVQEMLRLVGLEGFERRYPHELSGGQQQRVALARALVQHPVLLLLDEPFSNLDPDMAGRMRQELHDLLRRTKTTTMLVTHDHDEAFAMADRIAVLNQGRLEQFDTPETIYHMPATPFVADFVGQADFIPGTVSSGMVHTELGEFPDTLECEDGTSVVVMIRPDDIHLVPTKAATSHVLSRQFRGSENIYAVSLPSGQIVHSSQGSTSVYQEGTPVELRVLATHTVLFKQAGPGQRNILTLTVRFPPSGTVTSQVPATRHLPTPNRRRRTFEWTRLNNAVDYGIIGLLLALSVWSVAIAVERWLYYRRVDLAQFASQQTLEIALTKRLVVIGTVAANAPYIGLLGTVLGIMLTFHTMGTSGTMAVNTIMIGLSLALKATAVGLLVAIPCVVMNNILRRKVSELVAQYKVMHGSRA